MNIFTLISIYSALVISVHGIPHLLLQSDLVSEDEVLLRKNIDDIVRFFGNISRDHEIVEAILKSVDRDCVVDQYKKNKLENMLSEEALDLWNEKIEKPIDPLLAFGIIGITCSKKLNLLLGFAFDNIISYSSLLDAFREDEPFKTLLEEELVCFNNHAVTSNLLDPNEYTNFNYKLENKTEEDCEETVNSERRKVLETIGFPFDGLFLISEQTCLMDTAAFEIEKLLFKFVLLITVPLTDDQKKQKRVNFIADGRQMMYKLLSCYIKEKNQKINEIPT